MASKNSKKRNSFVVVQKGIEAVFNDSQGTRVLKEFKQKMLGDEKIKQFQTNDWNTGSIAKIIRKKEDRNAFREWFLNEVSKTEEKKKKTKKPKDAENMESEKSNTLKPLIAQSDEPLTDAEEPNEDEKNEKDDETKEEIDEKKEEIKESENDQNDSNNSEPKYGNTVKLDDGRTGIVKYFGKTTFSKGYWYGIGLDDEYEGKHNGRVNGIQYFKTNPNRAVFVKINRIVVN